MAETTQLDDFIAENVLMERFSIAYSALNRARKQKALPYYQIGSQGGSRLYLKQEVVNYFISCRKTFETRPKPRTKKKT